MKLNWLLVMWAAIFLALLSAHAFADPALNETRCCVTPIRNADGSIHRRSDVLRAFKKIHPCPATGLSTGACPGWAINHNYPLACGGLDIVSNLMWLPTVLKSGRGFYPIDRWERKIMCLPRQIVIMPLDGILTVIEK